MKHWNFVDKLDGDDSVLSTFKENPPNVYGFGHTRYLEEVVSAIRSGKSGVVDGYDGPKSLTLINAFYESMETGAEVKLETPSIRDSVVQAEPRSKICKTL